MIASRIAQLDLKVVGFADATGALSYTVVEDLSDTIFLQGETEDDETVWFESEAYHLPLWCEDNDFIYYSGDVEVEAILEAE